MSTFDGLIIRPARVDPDEMVNIPLLLSKEGAGRVTIDRLQALRVATGRLRLRFVTDSRLLADKLASPCYLTDYTCRGSEIGWHVWRFAERVHYLLGINIDVEHGAGHLADLCTPRLGYLRMVH